MSGTTTIVILSIVLAVLVLAFLGLVFVVHKGISSYNHLAPDQKPEKLNLMKLFTLGKNSVQQQGMDMINKFKSKRAPEQKYDIVDQNNPNLTVSEIKGGVIF